jgi:TolB-like protein
MAVPPPGAVVRFGTFEIDLHSGELRKGGLRIVLQDQPRAVLLALLERPGTIVAREELCARLWPHGTFVDFEHSLNAAVRRLRLALGDHADIPRFIETVHKRGYRFLAIRDVLVAPDARHRPASPATIAHIVLKRLRLAVLPFGPGDVFTDGLTEDAVTQLTQTCPCTIGVIARTSVAHAQRAGGGAAEIARKLSADYLVDGHVRREGDRVRITAQLIDSRAETHLWADTFDRVMTNTLAVQTEVAEGIAQGVAAALTGNR